MTIQEAIVRMERYKRRLIVDLDDPPSLRDYDHHRIRFEEINRALELMRQVTPSGNETWKGY